MFQKITIAIVALLAVSSFAEAQDAARGRAVAQQRCGICHNVNGGSRPVVPGAPPFRTVARQPGFSANWLAIHMSFAHKANYGAPLQLGEANDIGAYIATLRPR